MFDHMDNEHCVSSLCQFKDLAHQKWLASECSCIENNVSCEDLNLLEDFPDALYIYLDRLPNSKQWQYMWT